VIIGKRARSASDGLALVLQRVAVGHQHAARQLVAGQAGQLGHGAGGVGAQADVGLAGLHPVDDLVGVALADAQAHVGPGRLVGPHDGDQDVARMRVGGRDDQPALAAAAGVLAQRAQVLDLAQRAARDLHRLDAPAG
jgi:hypothetical protein